MSDSDVVILPDYYSEENWNYFVSCLPDSESCSAPLYEDAAKSLDEVESEFVRQGKTPKRVKVDAREWERWVAEHKKALSRKSVSEFAFTKHTEELNKSRPTWQ